jgi:hypothetical protein|tara:strand:- start:1062 stop:1184 length:123 start_codon:yes stop_codon:yes gene_type:complete
MISIGLPVNAIFGAGVHVAAGRTFTADAMVSRGGGSVVML